MSRLITNPKTYAGKENNDLVLRPLFTGDLPEQMGIRVIVDVKSKITLNFIGILLKILMPYTKGFQGGTNSKKYQKTIELAEYKAEMSYEKHDYADMIFYEIVNNGGIKQNDITGTIIMNTELKVFGNAITADVIRDFWLGDKGKVHINDGTYPDGTAYVAGDPDLYYNNADGIITSIMDDEKQPYTTKHAAISGWNKTTYPVLYIAGGATAYAYGSAADRTAGVAGTRLFSFPGTATSYPEVKTITELNSSGFGGYLRLLAATTSIDFEIPADKSDKIPYLLVADPLGTDGAADAMKVMISIASAELKAIKDAGQAKFYCTQSWIDNYRDTLESGTLESSRTAMINGIKTYYYDGVELKVMPIDSYIEADFATTFPRDICILSTPQNLALVLNGAGDKSETRLWFNPDENENRQRSQFEMSMDYILPELIVIAHS